MVEGKERVNESPTASLEKKLEAMIREKIPDLLSDEDLKKIVHSVVSKTFMERREYSSWSTKPMTPAFIDIVEGLVRPMVERSINDWLAENREIVLVTIKQCIECGIAGMVENYIMGRVQWLLQSMVPAAKDKAGT